jgi:hypothetical protein
MRFTTVVELGGKTATGLRVPDDVVATLGPSRRPAVRITIGSHTYRTTVASMGGRFMVPLSAENRAAAGVAAGDVVEVGIEPDAEPRVVPLPTDLSDALEQGTEARAFFDALAPSHRKEWVRWVEEAKRPETRARRIAETAAAMRAGRRAR